MISDEQKKHIKLLLTAEDKRNIAKEAGKSYSMVNMVCGQFAENEIIEKLLRKAVFEKLKAKMTPKAA
jgi:hypothetical protein